MNLYYGKQGNTYKILEIKTEDDELKSFLFTLGCYSGECITIINKKKSGLTVVIKDGRYNIDCQLAKIIIVQSN